MREKAVTPNGFGCGFYGEGKQFKGLDCFSKPTKYRII
jgi:hypothetical protein